MNSNTPQLRRSQFDPFRIASFYAILVIVFSFYLLRLFNLQVINGSDYLIRADENRRREVNIQTQRGIIFDRNGIVLARNIPSYNVTITPALLPGDESAIQEIYRQLSQLIDLPVNRGQINDQSVRLYKPCESNFGITQIVYIADTNAPYSAEPIKCNIDDKTALIIQEKSNDWPGVGIQVNPVRDYPTGELTAEIIGFLGPIPATRIDKYQALGFDQNRDKIGYAGVEASLNDLLMGKNGKRVIERDVAGQDIRDLEPPIDPSPGNNIYLTIDTRLQRIAEVALISSINELNRVAGTVKSTNGAVIAVNPKTGEILALVSYPSYENNRMARLIPAYYYKQLSEDPNRPLFNRAISGEFPPGSVFKLATGIGVMNERVVAPEFQIKDPGKITVNQKFSVNDPGTPRDYVCWEPTGHGLVDYVHSIAWSCDVYYYKVSGGYQDEVPQGLGITKLAQYARSLGYGEASGIELPGEAPGLIPDPDWKRIYLGETWATGDTYIASMGQGFVLSTPLQVLMAFATLANDGKYMKPTIIKEVVDSNGKVIKPNQPVLVRDITKDKVIDTYDENQFATGNKKSVEPWVIALAKQGMRLVVEPGGTADAEFTDFDQRIQSAGKTGTAEYCDNLAQQKNLCRPGNWPAHAWYSGYAPYTDPEIAVVAFVYSGNEGSTISAPIVQKVMEGYFDLKSIDSSTNTGSTP
jgi:penicillin-binding protein 2